MSSEDNSRAAAEEEEAVPTISFLVGGWFC
jgi:hypothetical protein